ncbi:uncharacterized protein FN964_008938 [Alca torda]
MRCSVTMDTQGLATQREIASAIQGSSTSSLKDLWMIAFPHDVKIELTCGVESFKAETCFKELACDPEKRTAAMALVGITPEDCKRCALCALMKGWIILEERKQFSYYFIRYQSTEWCSHQ